MYEIDHVRLLIILGITLIPGIWQMISVSRIHWMWLAAPMAAAIFTVIVW